MQQFKDQILSNIKNISIFPTSKLYEKWLNKQSWNWFTDWELKKYIEGVLIILKKIQKDISILDSIWNSNISNLNAYIQNFSNSLQNSGIQNIDIEQITSQHLDPLNNIENLNNHLRNSGIYNELAISSHQIKKANQEFLWVQDFLDEIIRDKPIYEQALISLQGLLNSQQEVNSAVLNWHANAFKERAEQYLVNNFTSKDNFFNWGIKIWKWGFWKEKNKSWLYIWVFSGFIFAFITGFITLFNIFPNQSEVVTTWQAILRIASIIVPSYLTVFSFSQYLYWKKMHESYMFKFASLQTMNSLISTNSDLKEKILSRWLDVLFTEPNSKAVDASKEDKQIIGELLSMVRWQLK